MQVAANSIDPALTQVPTVTSNDRKHRLMQNRRPYMVHWMYRLNQAWAVVLCCVELKKKKKRQQTPPSCRLLLSCFAA